MLDSISDAWASGDYLQLGIYVGLAVFLYVVGLSQRIGAVYAKERPLPVIQVDSWLRFSDRLRKPSKFTVSFAPTEKARPTETLRNNHACCKKIRLVYHRAAHWLLRRSSFAGARRGLGMDFGPVGMGL